MKRVNKMKWSVRQSVVLILAISIGGIATLHAEEAPSSQASPVNAFLMPKMEEIMKSSMKVIKEDEGVVSMTPPGNHSFAQGTQMLFFRKKGSRLEMIATGKVLTEETDVKTHQFQIKVELDKDTIIKYPIEGDYAAPLADPTASNEANKKDENDYLLPEEPPPAKPNHRPGYLEAGAGLLYGQLTSTSTTVANDAKASSAYRFKNVHFAYFSELVPFGLELDSHGGSFPTSTFYHKVVASSESVSILGIHYRFEPILNKKLEFVAKVSSLSDQFTTDNKDENLLSTKVSGMGLGLRLNFNLEKPNWKPQKGESFLTLQAITAEAVYYPMLTASDTLVSRGTDSGGSTGMQLRISTTLLAYLNFIPVLKRWVFQGSYGFRSYNLKFSGPTVSENVLNPITIPQGTHATEKESDLRFFLGVRFDDPLKSLFDSGKKKP
jgi:hypothetical protein